MTKRKWSAGDQRKKPRLFVETDDGMPIHCDGCKRATFFQKVDEKTYECPKCGAKITLGRLNIEMPEGLMAKWTGGSSSGMVWFIMERLGFLSALPST